MSARSWRRSLKVARNELLLLDRDDVCRREVQRDFVSRTWGDGCGGEGVHLGDFDWGGAFEFEEVLGGFSEVGGMEEFGWEGVWGAWLFEGDGFGADGDEGVT